MADEQTHEAAERPKPIDFFISYTGVDRAWAVWIAWQLEAAGYTTVIQAWDFLAGNSFVQEMDQATLQAERTIAVLSSDYFQSRFTPSEWQEAFRRDPTGAAGLLLPIRVRECEAAGLLGARGYLDLVGLDEQAAREKLLTKVRRTRAKPDVPPTFPGSGRPASLPASVPPIFPSLVSSTFWNTPLDIFISCAQNDQELCAELVKHLTSLKRQRIVREWHIGYIIPNTLQEPKILKHLAKAQVILLLISEYFLNSEFCSSSEMNYALARHKAGQVCIVPILLRPPVGVLGKPFTDLPMLPENKIAVTSWSNKDQAYVAIVEGIRRVIGDLIPHLQFTDREKKAPDTSGGQSQQVSLWHVPPMNPYFTGRDEALERLHEMLTPGGRALPHVAIVGLDGSGKTQLALEYTYRYGDEYQQVLWIEGSSDEFTKSLSRLSEKLHISVAGRKNSTRLIEAIREWLQEHREWLLVLDEIDDLMAISSLLLPEGHVLLTTHSRSINDTAKGHSVQLLELGNMTPEEGTQFLLRLSQPLAKAENITEEEQEAAQAIVKRLGGLPAALYNVGRYIQSKQLSLSAYNKRYFRNEQRWLEEAYRSVDAARLWLFSFKRIAQVDAAAYDLLRLCAFLHHNAIPEQMLQQGVDDLPPSLREKIRDDFDFDRVIEKLFHHSLVHRRNETLTMHCLVQVALQGSLSWKEQQVWAERVVSLVNCAFPRFNGDNEKVCEYYLKHANACARLVTHFHVATLDAAYLLDKLGYYFFHCKYYEKANECYEQISLICQTEQKSEGSNITVSLEQVADIYKANGKHEDAEDLRARVLRIRQQNFGPEHPDVITMLQNYRKILQETGKQPQNASGLERLEINAGQNRDKI